MVKKYHQTRKDRRDESRGMERYEESRKGPMDSQFYGMISEDHGEPANLPKDVVYHEYPKCSYMNAYELDDTIRGIDDTRDDEIRKIERYHSDVKY